MIAAHSSLKRSASGTPIVIASESDVPVRSVRRNWEEILQPDHPVLGELLANFLLAQRWFGGKGRRLRSVSVEEAVPVRTGRTTAHLLFLSAQYQEGAPETYLLPLAYASGEAAAQRLSHNPGSVLVRLKQPNGEEGIVLKRGAIATTAATRVSWYYPGQTVYTNTDANTGMCYRYAARLVRDRMACGDAHYQMMIDVPNEIWMNHCVFNLYGDPSVAYAAGPTVSHTPHGDTDVTSSPYVINAQITTNGPIKSGSPTIRWNTNGGPSFISAPMSLVSGNSYRGQIPGQPYGTTVYYYIHVEDVQGRIALSPSSAPNALHSFKVRTDSQPPVIQHTPPGNTGDLVGPYPVRATVTDNTGAVMPGVTVSIAGQSLIGGVQTRGEGRLHIAP